MTGLFCLRDQRGGDFSTVYPITGPDEKAIERLALRYFSTDKVQSALGGMVAEYPEDFVLVRVGYFDELEGKIISDRYEYHPLNDLYGEKGSDDASK